MQTDLYEVNKNLIINVGEISSIKIGLFSSSTSDEVVRLVMKNSEEIIITLDELEDLRRHYYFR